MTTVEAHEVDWHEQWERACKERDKWKATYELAAHNHIRGMDLALAETDRLRRLLVDGPVEYHRVVVVAEKFGEQLAKMGADGWRLVDVQYHQENDPRYTDRRTRRMAACVLQRPLVGGDERGDDGAD